MASSYRTLNLDVLTVKTILVKSATNSNIPINTVLASDGRGGTSWRNPNILFASSLSTISSITYQLTYGLSTITYPGYGLSSLSSIVSYGLSSILGGPIDNVPNSGVSSLSSIISYGLSSVSAGAQNPGVSSLSSIISYGLSSVQTINITCNISNIQVGGTQCNITNNYINSNGTGISSLSSIVSYGLSTVYSPYGISSLSSIVSYGLSSLGGAAGEGVSSLSSIVSYGLSSLGAGGATGISSLSSIVSYGLSSLGAGGATGISSLSSIVSYGLSSLGGAAGTGVSSLSSIVSYGLSSFSLNSIPFKSIIYNSGTNINFTNGQINPSVNTVYGFSVYSCAYGNNLWVIGGAVNQSTPYGLMYSLNGINWNNSSFATPFTMTATTDYTNNIKYIESNFVATVKFSNNWYFIWSSNGINWNRNTTNITRQVFDYAYNNSNNTWQLVVFPQTGPTKTSILITSNIFVTSGNTFTNIISGGFTTNGCGISYNNNIWVAVGINSNGFSNVQYSINGTNWSNASNVTYKSSSNILRTTAGFGATSVVYVAPNWYVAGAGGTSNNPIYRSSDGRNYTAIATSNTSNINIVLSLIYDSNSSQFYSLANIDNLSGYTGNYLISSVNNCSNWSVISPFTYSDAKQIGLAAGVITPPVQTTAVFASNIYANTVNTAYITGNGSGLVNVNLGAFSLDIPLGANPVDQTTTTVTAISNGLIFSNIFSNSQLIYPGKYLVNIKFYLQTVSGNWATATPYIYISHFNESLEDDTYSHYAYLSRKAIYPINTAFKWHTLTDTIVTTTNASPTNQYNLYYSEQSSPGAYSMNLYFTDIIVVRIA